jgi:hypothetical protein
MTRETRRIHADNFSINILMVNGEIYATDGSNQFCLDNIGKGGFRFSAAIKLELEDRVQVLLHFPDGHSQEVLGRICYNETLEANGMVAYGFSVMQGFYALVSSA